MVAAERHARKDHLGLAGGNPAARAERVADDLVVGLGVDEALVDGDAGAARVALSRRLAEAGDLVRLAVAVGVLQRDQEAARRGRLAHVIGAAPGVDVEGAAGGEGHVAHVAEIVGEHRGAEAGGQDDAAAVAGAGAFGGPAGGGPGGEHGRRSDGQDDAQAERRGPQQSCAIRHVLTPSNSAPWAGRPLLSGALRGP